ncbi:hypothetical protein ACHAWU_001382 [Discostella pseudostelligera]|uniref:subtilisin n=1 Tax=Discostella pseudostelligera TaxID=259834 RepID=A0ABD3M440_9STRA
MVSTKLSFGALSILSLVSAILPQIASAVVDFNVDVDVDVDDDVAPIPKSNLRGLATSDAKTYIVSFNDKDVSPEKRCAAIAKANGGTVGYIYADVLNGCSITLPVSQFQAQSTITALNNRPEVKLVNEDQMMYITQSEVESAANDSLFTSQAVSVSASVTAKSWGLDRVDQCSLPLNNLATKQSATGVRVFILDTGVQSTHQEFTGMISTANAWTAYTDPFTDEYGHGTHVAGTACGLNYGVASNCVICPVQVLSSTGSGFNSDVIAGINFVVGKCKGAAFRCVINMSLGSGTNSQLNAAVNGAVSNGVVVVVAAGNDAKDACNYSPASAADAITVGSTTDKDEKSPFSNIGNCVDVYAPGSDIISASSSSNTGSKTLSGTSMASPHVAGMAAAILSQNPSLTPKQVRDSIVNKALMKPSTSTIPTWYIAVDCSTSSLTSQPTLKPTTKSPTAKPTTKSPTGKPSTNKPTVTKSPTGKPTLTAKPTTVKPTTKSPTSPPIFTPTSGSSTASPTSCDMTAVYNIPTN